jgi:hypothetical protein
MQCVGHCSLPRRCVNILAAGSARRQNGEYYLPRNSRTIYDGAADTEGEKPLRLKGLNVVGC